MFVSETKLGGVKNIVLFQEKNKSFRGQFPNYFASILLDYNYLHIICHLFSKVGVTLAILNTAGNFP